MIYPTILAHEQYSQAGLNQMSLQTGTVIAHQPGTNMLQVRLPGAGDRVIERVLAPYDSTFQSGDRVLIVKSPAEAWWMAVCRLQNPDQYGLYSSSAMHTKQLYCLRNGPAPDRAMGCLVRTSAVLRGAV